MRNPPILIRRDPKSYLLPKEENHDIPLSFRVSKRIHRLVEIMFADVKGQTPWRTQTDFLRWAVEQGLRSIAEDMKGGRFPEFWKQYQAQREIARDAEMQSRVGELVEESKERVREYERIGAHREAAGWLRQAYSSLCGMEGNVWVNRAKKDFEVEFGDRMKKYRINVRPSEAIEEDDE